MGEMVTFPANGRTADGYLATPPSGRGPGILARSGVLGAGRPHQGGRRSVGRRGVRRARPRPVSRREAKSPDDAGKLMMALNIAEAAKDLRGAADYLVAASDVSPKRVAVVGILHGRPARAVRGVRGTGSHLRRRRLLRRAPGRVSPTWRSCQGRCSRTSRRATSRRRRTSPTRSSNGFVAAGKEIEAHFYEADHAFFNDRTARVYNRRGREAGVGSRRWRFSSVP